MYTRLLFVRGLVKVCLLCGLHTYARVAQLVERGAYTSVVLGSSPSARTKIDFVFNPILFS